jgi:hypothetical protein
MNRLCFQVEIIVWLNLETRCRRADRRFGDRCFGNGLPEAA